MNKVTLGELPAGSLFEFEGTIALKSEYYNHDNIEAIIVGSGEQFWGGANSGKELENLLVTPIDFPLAKYEPVKRETKLDAEEIERLKAATDYAIKMQNLIGGVLLDYPCHFIAGAEWQAQKENVKDVEGL